MKNENVMKITPLREVVDITVWDAIWKEINTTIGGKIELVYFINWGGCLTEYLYTTVKEMQAEYLYTTVKEMQDTCTQL